MKLLFALLTVVAAVALSWWYRKKSVAPAEALPHSNRFHAVTIHTGEDACPAVRALASRKYLAKEAPRLPLDECSALNCQCRYEYYDDRRAKKRREPPTITHYAGQQRRARKDRRKAQA